MPGSPDPLYLLGARIRELYPFITVTGNIGVIVGVLSYLDALGLPLTVDADVVPDLDRLMAAMAAAADALVEQARVPAVTAPRARRGPTGVAAVTGASGFLGLNLISLPVRRRAGRCGPWPGGRRREPDDRAGRAPAESTTSATSPSSRTRSRGWTSCSTWPPASRCSPRTRGVGHQRERPPGRGPRRAGPGRPPARALLVGARLRRAAGPGARRRELPPIDLADPADLRPVEGRRRSRRCEP